MQLATPSFYQCMPIIFNSNGLSLGDTRWYSWLRHCATGRRVAVSITDSVIEIFH